MAVGVRIGEGHVKSDEEILYRRLNSPSETFDSETTISRVSNRLKRKSTLVDENNKKKKKKKKEKKNSLKNWHIFLSYLNPISTLK